VGNGDGPHSGGDGVVVADQDTIDVERGPRPSFPAGRSAITDWPLPDLVRLGRWIESDGHLRTEEDLRTALMEEIGIKRRGSRVLRILDEVIALMRA
jgi:hypothetical protein